MPLFSRHPIRTAFALVALLAIAGGVARTQEKNALIGGEELRRILNDSTVWVVRQDLTVGDEYHLADGRVFGFNGFETIENGCWDIVGDQVCYYYKDDWAKGIAHCWTFRHADTDRFHLSDSRGFTGYGRRESGNPRNYSDNGKPWQCKRLMSQAPQGLRNAAIAATGQ